MGEVFLLLGPERGLKEDFINNKKHSLGECEVSKFYTFDDYENELYAQLNNSDLFAEKKLIILDEAQELKTKDKTKGIVDYIKNPSDSVTFIISSKDLYINKDIMNAVKPDNIIKFYELFENKKIDWLKNFFRRVGMEIQGDACSAITEKVENNVQEFEAVCSQIATYCRGIGKKTVTQKDIEEFLSHTRQETDFTLFGYIVRKDLSGALECLDALIHTNDETGLTSVLASKLSIHFRRLYSIEENISRGMQFDDAVKAKFFDTDRPVIMLKEKGTYKAALENFNKEDIKRILKKLVLYDTETRETGTYLQQFIMEKCIMDIIIRKCR